MKEKNNYIKILLIQAAYFYLLGISVNAVNCKVWTPDRLGS